MIGRVGTLLGNAGVNVATFQLGRDTSKERAISMINLDSKIDESLLAEIAAISEIIEAKQVSL